MHDPLLCKDTTGLIHTFHRNLHRSCCLSIHVKLVKPNRPFLPPICCLYCSMATNSANVCARSAICAAERGFTASGNLLTDQSGCSLLIHHYSSMRSKSGQTQITRITSFSGITPHFSASSRSYPAVDNSVPRSHKPRRFLEPCVDILS